MTAAAVDTDPRRDQARSALDRIDALLDRLETVTDDLDHHDDGDHDADR